MGGVGESGHMDMRGRVPALLISHTPVQNKRLKKQLFETWGVSYKYTCPSSVCPNLKIQSQSGFAKIKTCDTSQCHGGVRSGLLIPGRVGRSIGKHPSVHSRHQTIDSTRRNLPCKHAQTVAQRHTDFVSLSNKTAKNLEITFMPIHGEQLNT